MPPLPFSPALAGYVWALAADPAPADAARRATLDSLVTLLAQQYETHGQLALVYICTHNSRRSHLAQVWGQLAALYFDIPGVYTYSGGTEATAFNPRAVAALRRAGFQITGDTTQPNPEYALSWGSTTAAMRCFSKHYAHPANPQRDFVALMVCTDADEACPAVPGAAARFALPYVDPKLADGSATEAATYDQRCVQIARQQFYLFRELAAVLR
jgi:protein-tyrosine-phosphatase